MSDEHTNAFRKKSEPNRADYWPCACVRRYCGKVTHIKLNHKSIKRCTVCGMTPIDESKK
jgi:hypothetical protein